jgi:hypothetical protein
LVSIGVIRHYYRYFRHHDNLLHDLKRMIPTKF